MSAEMKHSIELLKALEHTERKPDIFDRMLAPSVEGRISDLLATREEGIEADGIVTTAEANRTREMVARAFAPDLWKYNPDTGD